MLNYILCSCINMFNIKHLYTLPNITTLEQ